MDTENEEWRKIIDRFNEESRYEVSTLGRVRSQNYGFEGKIIKGGEGPDNPSGDRRTVWLSDLHHGQSRLYRVDMLVADTFLGNKPAPDSKPVHLNGYRWDDRAENLAWEAPLEHTPTPTHRGMSLRQAVTREKDAWKAAHKALEDAADATRLRASVQAGIEAQEGVQGAQGE